MLQKTFPFNVLLKRYLASRAVTSLQKLEGVKSSSPIISEGGGLSRRYHRLAFERDAEVKVDILLGPISRQTVVICKGNLSCASSDAKEGGACGNDVDFAGIDRGALRGTGLGEA